jgi:hypothetical protein
LGTACGGNLIGWLRIVTVLLVGKGFSLVGIKKEEVLIGGIEDCAMCILLAKGTVCDILIGWDQECHVLIG